MGPNHVALDNVHSIDPRLMASRNEPIGSSRGIHFYFFQQNSVKPLVPIEGFVTLRDAKTSHYHPINPSNERAETGEGFSPPDGNRATMTGPQPDWERQLYEFLDASVPDPVLERGVLTIADVLAAAVAGSAVGYNDRIGRVAEFADGHASIIGGSRTTAPGQAALVNAASAITQEIEEGHNTGGHVGAGLVTGGFALAEQYDADGEAFVEAAVKAYEICVRIEHAIFAIKERMNETLPWLVRDPHSTWTTIGPALTGALSMGLDRDQIRETVRIAANLAVVSMHDPYEEGAPARNYTAGFSAQAGVNAALTAGAGLAGSRRALSAVYEPLGEVTDGTFEHEMAELGDVWEVQRNYFKLTPSCRYTHPPIGAIDEIRDEIDPDTVESIDIYSFRNATDLDYADPTNLTSAKFSIPYVVARSILVGDLSLDDFSDTAIADERTRSLAGRVTIHFDPTYEEEFPDHWSARVEVTHADGRTVSAECIDPPGDFRRQPDRERLETLFHELLMQRFEADQATEALEAILDLRNRDVRTVGEMLMG